MPVVRCVACGNPASSQDVRVNQSVLCFDCQGRATKAAPEAIEDRTTRRARELEKRKTEKKAQRSRTLRVVAEPEDTKASEGPWHVRVGSQIVNKGSKDACLSFARALGSMDVGMIAEMRESCRQHTALCECSHPGKNHQGDGLRCVFHATCGCKGWKEKADEDALSEGV